MSSAGDAGKKDGMSRADRHANAAWKYAADVATLEAALDLQELTADDVVQRMDPTVDTHEWRALGPVLTRAAKAGWIEKANGKTKNCERANCHSAPLTVWRSLVYQGGEDELGQSVLAETA